MSISKKRLPSLSHETDQFKQLYESLSNEITSQVNSLYEEDFYISAENCQVNEHIKKLLIDGMFIYHDGISATTLFLQLWPVITNMLIFIGDYHLAKFIFDTLIGLPLRTDVDVYSQLKQKCILLSDDYYQFAMCRIILNKQKQDDIHEYRMNHRHQLNVLLKQHRVVDVKLFECFDENLHTTYIKCMFSPSSEVLSLYQKLQHSINTKDIDAIKHVLIKGLSIEYK